MWNNVMDATYAISYNWQTFPVVFHHFENNGKKREVGGEDKYNDYVIQDGHISKVDYKVTSEICLKQKMHD